MKQKSAFTLVELLIAIFLLSISILIIFRLKLSTSNFVDLHDNTFKAYNLAVQGKEIFRGISGQIGIDEVKNRNLLTNEEDQFLIITKNDYIYDIEKKNDPDTLVSLNAFGDVAGPDENITYQRKIKLTEDEILKNNFNIAVHVSWNDQAGKHETVVRDIIY